MFCYIVLVGSRSTRFIYFPRVPFPLAGAFVSGRHAVDAQPAGQEQGRVRIEPRAAEVQALMLVVSARHAADAPFAEYEQDRVLFVEPRAEEVVQALMQVVSGHRTASVFALAVSGHHTADARALGGFGVSVPPAACDPSRCGYTFRALHHHASHAYTNHNCPNAVYDPMSASCYRNHGSVSGNIPAAHSEYIPVVQQR